MPGVVAPLIESETSVAWEKVKFFAVDERMVPLEDKESNTGCFLLLLPGSFRPFFLEYGPIEDRKYKFIFSCLTSVAVM